MLKWLALIVTPVLAFAEATSVQVKQVLIDRHRAVVTASEPLIVGTELVVTFPNGKQCSLKVTASKNNLSNVDTSTCPFEKDLTVGQKLEMSMAVDEPEMVEEAPKKAPPPPKAVVKIEPAQIKRRVTDIEYVPAKGKFAASFEYGEAKSTTSVKLKNGSQNVSTVDSKSSPFDFQLGYGISDQIAIGYFHSYVPSASTNISYGPGSVSNGTTVKSKSDGFTDPELALNYRAIEQKYGPVDLDFTLKYSPKGDNDVSATATKKGNRKRGGDLTSVRGAIERREGQFSYGASLQAAIHGPETSEDADTKEKTKGETYTEISLSVVGQAELSESFFLRGTIGIQRTTDQKFVTEGSTDETTSKAYNQPAAGIRVMGLMSPKVVGYFDVTKTFEVDAEAQVGTTELVGTNSGTVWSLGVGVEF